MDLPQYQTLREVSHRVASPLEKLPEGLMRSLRGLQYPGGTTNPRHSLSSNSAKRKLV